MTIQLPELTTHYDVPTTYVSNYKNFVPMSGLGASKYRCQLPRQTHLDAFLINKQSQVLIVALHGATDRSKKLPRFEWMRTLRELEYSSLYFSDPCLELDEKLQLSWYTGWNEFDLYPLLAQWITKAASTVKATKILILGSSGGGLASLQISTLIPGSVALPLTRKQVFHSIRLVALVSPHNVDILKL